MLHRLRALSLALLSIGFTVAVANADIVDVDGSCTPGVCGTTPELTAGETSGPTSFSFLYTAGSGDQYTIAGQYAASFVAPDYLTVFSADVTATYTGNKGTTSAADSFTVDVLSNFYDSDCCTWAGLYTENVVLPSFTAPPGSSFVGNFLWDGVGIQPLTFTAAGSQSASATLGDPNPPYDPTFTQALLTADFDAQFTFAAGTTAGDGVAVVSTPEPFGVYPVMLVGMWLGLVWMQKRRKVLKEGGNR